MALLGYGKHQDTEMTADFLTKNGIKCDYYHAGMSKTQRNLVQSGWSLGRIRIVCATIACTKP